MDNSKNTPPPKVPAKNAMAANRAFVKYGSISVLCIATVILWFFWRTLFLAGGFLAPCLLTLFVAVKLKKLNFYSVTAAITFGLIGYLGIDRMIGEEKKGTSTPLTVGAQSFRQNTQDKILPFEIKPEDGKADNHHANEIIPVPSPSLNPPQELPSNPEPAVSNADEPPFIEAQESVLKMLDFPFGPTGQHTVHIRLPDIKKAGIYELSNPTLRIHLGKGEELSAADKLNGKIQNLWTGDAMLTADACRLVTSYTDPIAIENLKYQRWEEVPSPFKNGCIKEFRISKTSQGWKITEFQRRSAGGEPPYDKIVPLFTEQKKLRDLSCSEEEVETAFRPMIHDQSDSKFFLVERTLPTFSDFLNEDRFHEFSSPSLRFQVLPTTTVQSLNGDVVASIRVVCQAHRFPKIIKSRTRQTPALLPVENDPWGGKERIKQMQTWMQPSDQKERTDCDYVGIRQNGKWTFTVSAYFLNPAWLGKIVLIPKSGLPSSEYQIETIGHTSQ